MATLPIDTTVHCNFRNGSSSGGPQCMRGWLDDTKMYGVYVQLDAHGIAYRVNMDGTGLETVRLDALVSNRLESPLVDDTDAHYFWAVGVDDQDKVFITGNHHDANGADPDPANTHLIVCNNVNAFTNPASWAAGVTSQWDALASGGASQYPKVYTYHYFDRDNNGVLFHFLSQSESGTTTQGRDYLAFKRSGGVWSPVVGDGHFATTENGPSDEADRVYVNGILIENQGAEDGVNDRLHVIGIWRTTDASVVGQQAPWYLYADGPTYDVWKYKDNPTDGTQTMPLTWFNRSGAEVDSAPASSQGQVFGGIYLDDNGYPSWFVEDEDTNVQVRLHWSGTAWETLTETNYPGEMVDFRIKNRRFMRKVTTGWQHLRDMDAGVNYVLGHSIPTSGDSLSPQPCPVTLRGKSRAGGAFWTCLPKGDDPYFYSFGNLVSAAP